MRFWTRGRVVPALGRVSSLCITLLVCVLPLPGSAKNSSRIVCREELRSTRRDELVDKLRAITGWPEVSFDRNGALQFGGVARDGSQTARDLLIQAQTGRNLLIIQDASNRQDVVFCRVVRAQWKNHTSDKPPTFVVLIDFSDFDHLMGDRVALKAFDVGWGFLHEIDHVVNDSADAATERETGECEDHINLMRHECNLPLRTDYFFSYFPYAQQSDFGTRFVRLAFDQDDAATTKRRRYWVIWDATLVGGVATQEIAERR